jgi:hypothetical protein
MIFVSVCLNKRVSLKVPLLFDLPSNDVLLDDDETERSEWYVTIYVGLFL